MKFKSLSYKNESGWVVLSKGSTLVTVSHGFTFLKVLEYFEKWKESLRENGFKIALLEYLNKVNGSVHHCCHLDIPTVAGKIPQKMQCCPMDGPMNAVH